jgi:hypothetical protein
MSAAAASGESFDLDSRQLSKIHTGFGELSRHKAEWRASPILYDVKLWRFIPIEAAGAFLW